MPKKLFILSLLVGVALSGVFVDEADAIPTFARKYRTSCTTCHIGFNKLNPFGKAYQLNGFLIPQGQETAYVKETPVSLGAPAWKKVWPEAVWPGSFSSNVPISMMVHQRMIFNESARSQDKPGIDFDFPHEWLLITGGNFGNFLSYFGEFVLFEDGEVEGAQRLFFQFNDLLSGTQDYLPEDAFNLKIGKFDIAADPFQNSTKRTLNKYLPSDSTVGGATFKMRNLQKGFEANGIIKSRLQYALGLVQSTGSGNSASERDGYWRLAYKFGGMALDGSSAEFGEELSQRNNWVDNAVTIGTFGYIGKEEVSGATNDFTRFGGDIHLQWEDLDLSTAFIVGDDDDPNATGVGVDTLGWFSQVEYVLFPWLIGAVRYERMDYDDTTNDVRKVVGALSIYPRANVRFILEANSFSDGEDGSNSLLADLAIVF
ncbi:MAG: hypothetical protein ACUZ8I_17605 [Candidatus Scalindua sp.]